MRRHPWSLAIGAALGAGLLVLLGALQVRWLDQVAQTIAAQKRAALHRQGTAVATDLERELTRAFFWFQLTDSTAPAEVLKERWQSWRQATPHPALVAALWLVTPETGDAGPTLRRLTPAGVLEPAAWPPALAEFRRFAGDRFRMAGLLSSGDAESAWLALPAEPGGRPAEGSATVLLQLDGAHLARVMLPALASAHRESADAGDAVMVRLEEPDGKPLFAGAPAAPLFQTGEHDPIVILGIRPDLATPALVEGIRPPRPWPPELRLHRAGPPGHPPPPPPGSAGMAIAFGPGPGLLPPRAFTRRYRAGADGPVMVRRFLPGNPAEELGPPGHWRLALAYAAGPVAEVVTSLRRRNLTLGFSALILLGGAIAALSVAVRRAQALADRQRQFMASVSHELRTPLAVIGAAAENLRDGTVDDGARVREYGAMIHAESKRLGAMMEQTLQLAAGKELEDQLRLRPVDVGAVVDAAVESFTPEVRARGGQIERSHPPDPALVAADPEALRQAVENVVGNAVKYGGEPPRVTVRVSHRDTPAGPEVQIAVEDRGMGIASDELAHLFEPFFRGREAQARQIRGTGLGLALVARVMRAHGGAVSVESSPGRGSLFVLRLPASQAGPA